MAWESCIQRVFLVAVRIRWLRIASTELGVVMNNMSFSSVSLDVAVIRCEIDVNMTSL
jgi:hypothetical protein